MLITDTIKLYARHCIAEGLKPRTLEGYMLALDAWNAYSQKQNVEQIEEVKPDLLQDYFIFIRGKEYSMYTVRGRYTALNIYFKYLVDQSILMDNPLPRALKKPKLPKERARTFKTNEILAILNHYDKNDFYGMRNFCIMCMFYGTGIRRTELLNLMVYDVDLDSRLLVVTGKGDKMREIPITPRLIRIIKQYMSMRKTWLVKNKTDCNYLFISRYGRRLSQDGLKEVFRELKDSLNLEGRRLSPHTWRHTFAKNFLVNGGNIFTLQKLLGHSDISTTQIYIDWTESEIRPQTDKFSPLENRSWSYF